MKMFGSFETRMNTTLVLEVCKGKSLYGFIKKKAGQKLLEKDSKKIFSQLASAIAYCHSKNVVHRDLKLDNVLIDEKGNIKLIDFGFCEKCAPTQKLSLYCGTPHYMDPDICQKKDYYG